MMLWRVEDRLTETAAILVGLTASLWIGELAMDALRVDYAPLPIEATSIVEPLIDPPVEVSTRPDPVAVPMVASELSPRLVAHSLDSGFSVRGSYEGDIRLTEAGLFLDLSKAEIRAPGQVRPTRLLGVRLSLGEKTADGDWRLVIEHVLWVEEVGEGEAHNAWTYVHADALITDRFLDAFDGC